MGARYYPSAEWTPLSICGHWPRMGWLSVAFDLLEFIFLKSCFLLFRGVIGKQGYQCQGKRVLYEVNPWEPQVNSDHDCLWKRGLGGMRPRAR